MRERGGLRPGCAGLGKDSAGEEKRKNDNRGTEMKAWLLSGLLRSEEVGGAVEKRGVGM